MILFMHFLLSRVSVLFYVEKCFVLHCRAVCEFLSFRKVDIRIDSKPLHCIFRNY